MSQAGDYLEVVPKLPATDREMLFMAYGLLKSGYRSDNQIILILEAYLGLAPWVVVPAVEKKSG